MTRNYEIAYQTIVDLKNSILKDKSSVETNKRYYVWSIDPEDQKLKEGIPTWRQSPGLLTAIDLRETPRVGTKILFDDVKWTITDIVISTSLSLCGEIQWNIEVTKKNSKDIDL